MLPQVSELVDLLTSVDKSERLELLVTFGDHVPDLEEPYRVMRDSGLHMILECEAPVFFLPEVRAARLSLHVDVPREAAVARGFVGLLKDTFDGLSPSDLDDTPDDLLEALGLLDLLTFRRRRGLTAIYRRLLLLRDETAGTTTQVCAVVLAAGRSERMGAQNKLLLDFQGTPVVNRVVRSLVEGGLEDIVVVLGHDADRVRSALQGMPIRFVYNDRFKDGMSTSIHAGILAAREDASGFMMCLADMPLIVASEYRMLISRFVEAVSVDYSRIVVPVHGGQRGNPVILPACYRPDILALEGPAGCRSLIERHRDLVVLVDMASNHVLVDIDTPDEWVTVRTR